MFDSKAERAIAKALTVCKAAADGDFEARILNITEDGQAGELLHAINNLIDRTDAYVRESQACLDYVSQNKYYRKISEKGMVGAFGQAARTINRATETIRTRSEEFAEIGERFQSHMQDVVSSVSNAVKQLQEMSGAADLSSGNARSQSSNVSTAAEHASANMSNVAAMTEELSNSIAEINVNVAHSSDISTDAVGKSQRMSARIESLVEASRKISEVVNLITDIAEQTNLLALNATIEAARAGDAGKGFAVVAQEVKTLAGQTSRATEEIGAQIAGIQSATNDAVESNEEINSTISTINEISTSIASAVEEQSAATREIARNVDEAASGTANVSESIQHVSAATDETQEAIAGMLKASAEISDQEAVLRGLREEMNTFLLELRKTG